MMDGRRMDVEGGRVVHRERRAGKLAVVVVVVQNVLLAACLLVTLYVCWGVQKQPSEDNGITDNVHIEFAGISDFSGNGMLPFNHISSSKMMSKDDDKIYINCTGPYILYMDVCYLSLSSANVSGTLQLKVVGRKNPLIEFTLTTSGKDCRGLHSIAYLRQKERASLYLNSHEEFKIKNATLGLSYLLGRECHH